MTRRNRHALPNSCILAAVLFHLGQVARGRLNPAVMMTRRMRMIAIVAALRTEEAKYRDIEYVVKITTRAADRQAPRASPRFDVAGDAPCRAPGRSHSVP